MAMQHQNTGCVILGENPSSLLELSHFYIVSEYEEIENAIEMIERNGIEVPLKTQPPHLINDILKQATDYVWENYALSSYKEILLEYLSEVRKERDVAIHECDYLKKKLRINNPRKEHIYKMVKKLYSIEPNSLSCSICIDTIDTDNLQMTNCGHIYCKECFRKNEEKTDNCAICRSKCYGLL